jgi:RNA polymerase subunit RPABC4/transcription elongation factor Spt4
MLPPIMFVSPRVIRCKKCTRLFSNYADKCPDCLARSPRGWVKVLAPVIAIAVSVATIAWIIQVLQSSQP